MTSNDVNRTIDINKISGSLSKCCQNNVPLFIFDCTFTNYQLKTHSSAFDFVSLDIIVFPALTFTFANSTIETLEKGVKYVQS